MTLLLLKLIACTAMLLDHIGALYENIPLRIVGRLAFPIFAFLIANGYRHTKNVGKYCLRLGVFALLSEIPYDLFMSEKIVSMRQQNVMFTLLLGLLCIVVIDFLKKRHLIWLSILPIALFCLFANDIRCDYGYIGVATVVVFYLFSEDKLLLFLSFFVVSWWIPISYMLYCNFPAIGKLPIIIRTVPPTTLQWIQLFRIFALLPIFMYNGEYGMSRDNPKKNAAVKYGFYLFYPLHLLLLYGYYTVFM